MMMEDKRMDELIQKVLNNSMQHIEKIFESKTFMCSIYLLKYIRDKDLDAWNKFISIFQTLAPGEMLQVFANVHANLEEHGKTKIKK